MNEGNSSNFCNGGNCKKNRFSWPPIKAVDACFVSPDPVVTPNQGIIVTMNRYFYVAVNNLVLTNGVTLPVSDFIDDRGQHITEFKLFSPNGYVNFYVNALMQEGNMYTVTPTTVTIPPTNGTIFRGTPIIIESLGFTLSSI